MFKVGDEVISKEFGNGVVTAKANVVSLDANPWFGGSYPWAVVFENNKTTRWFTKDGKYTDGSPEDDKYGIKLRYPRKIEATCADVTWHDYSFNQSIIDALKAGKRVWAEHGTIWSEIGRADVISLGAVYTWKWSLVKPTTKVKKWQWIFERQGRFNMTEFKYASREKVNEIIGYVGVEPYLPSEVEVEE